MRKPARAATSLAWFVVMGGTFGCLLPYLLGDWHLGRPLPYWGIARAAGVLLICAGLVQASWSEAAGRRRRVYQLTPAGRRALDTERSTWRDFSAAVTTLLQPAPLAASSP